MGFDRSLGLVIALSATTLSLVMVGVGVLTNGVGDDGSVVADGGELATNRTGGVADSGPPQEGEGSDSETSRLQSEVTTPDSPGSTSGLLVDRFGVGIPSQSGSAPGQTTVGEGQSESADGSTSTDSTEDGEDSTSSSEKSDSTTSESQSTTESTSTNQGSTTESTSAPPKSTTSTSSRSTTSTTARSATTSPPPVAGVVWEDHFNRLDLNRWKLEHSTYGDGNNELQCYRPENVSVRNGRLVLRAVNETYTCPNGSRRRQTSGMVRSKGVSFSPGQAIEFRVKLTPANPHDQGGLWPAVWSSGWAGGWPRGGELDFLEVMTAVNPKRSIYSMHFARPNGSHGTLNMSVVGDSYFSDSWHTIRFDYGKGGKFTWYLDGRKVFEVASANTAQGYPVPFDQTIREIKINLALGGVPGRWPQVPWAPPELPSRSTTYE